MIVRPSVSSLNHLTLHGKSKKRNIFQQEKINTFVNFYSWFSVTRLYFEQHSPGVNSIARPMTFLLIGLRT